MSLKKNQMLKMKVSEYKVAIKRSKLRNNKDDGVDGAPKLRLCVICLNEVYRGEKD